MVNGGRLTLGIGTVLKDACYLDTTKNEMYNNDMAVVTVKENGTVTLVGTHINHVAAAIVNATGSTVALRGNTVIENGLAAGNKGGLFIINGGTVTVEGNTAIRNNHMRVRSGAVIGLTNEANGIMNGGSITGNKAVGGSNTAGAMIVVESGATFTMNGGSITGNTGVLAGAIASRWTTGTHGENNGIELNGGIVSGNSTQKDSWGGVEVFVRSDLSIGEDMVVNGDVQVNGQGDGEGNAITFINNGTINGDLDITGTGADAASAGNISGEITVGGSNELTITGGTYGGDPSVWCEEGFTGVSIGDGRWNVVEIGEELDEQDKADVTFAVSPAEAKVTILDSEGEVCAVGGGETFTLLNGSYSYTVSASGYQSQSGGFRVLGEDQIITVTLSMEIPLPDIYDIEVIPGGNGAVKPNFSSASAGTRIILAVTPDEGYELSYITVDGERIDGTSFTMPAHDVEVRAYFVRIGADMPFTDVKPGDWFYDYVAYVYANGLMEGTSATTFAPDDNMTRAMLVTILWRVEGEPVVNYLMPFTDVPDGAWYAEAVRWAASEGIVEGVSAAEFAPDAEITREQLAAMLYRYAGEPAASGDLSAYTDAASVSAYAVNAMSWCVGHGIITGVTATTLDPQGTATRAQCAAMLMRFAEL